VSVKLSAVIITFNEEEHLDKCLSSLENIADEIVVVDSHSSDGTKTICKRHRVRFIEQKFLGYKEQKNYALKQAKYNHILSLDGDEALSDLLKDSVLELKKKWTKDGYYCSRMNNYCGQWIKHSDWYPDRKLRLFKKSSGQWGGLNPHDKFILHPGKTNGQLKGDLLHWIYSSYAEHNQKIEHFSSIAAKAYCDNGIKSSLIKILWRPSWAFFKAYFIRLGLLDGYNGWIICVKTFKITYLKYVKLRALYKHQKN